jgi:outer membrane protein assembly factor BamB
MKTIKMILAILILSILLSCCTSSGNSAPVESNFPLNQILSIPVDEVIQRLAVLDTWIAIGTPNKIIAMDIDTQKTLWSIDFQPKPGFDDQFQFINDTLVAASTDEIILLDRNGQKRKINLPLYRNNSKIIDVAAIYPNNLYIIRGSLRMLEAYDISKNNILWSIGDGRGAKVFLDPVNNIAYVATSYSLRAVDNATGDILWEKDTDSQPSAFEDGVLFICGGGDNKSTLHISAIDVNKQKELWKTDVANFNPVYQCTIIDNLLIANGGGGLIAVNKLNGNLDWRTSINEDFRTKPVKFKDIIYLKGPSFPVYAISPIDGKIVGFVKLEDANPFMQPSYEVTAGVYRLKDGIIFNSRNAVVIYKAK